MTQSDVREYDARAVSTETFGRVIGSAFRVSTGLGASGGVVSGLSGFASAASSSFIIVSARASWNLFDMLGVQPIAGRTFRPEEDVAGGPSVAVLSHEFATRLFASPTAALGQTLSLDSRDYTVIGVLPPSFSFALFGPRREIWAARPFDMNYVTPARVELGGTLKVTWSGNSPLAVGDKFTLFSAVPFNSSPIISFGTRIA